VKGICKLTAHLRDKRQTYIIHAYVLLRNNNFKVSITKIPNFQHNICTAYYVESEHKRDGTSLITLLLLYVIKMDIQACEDNAVTLPLPTCAKHSTPGPKSQSNRTSQEPSGLIFTRNPIPFGVCTREFGTNTSVA
jgi:hypothetical protein